MPTAMTGSQILKELSRALDERALEQVDGLIEDPSADHTGGELARLGKAFNDLGKYLTDTSKTLMISSAQGSPGGVVDSSVLFKYRKGGTQTRIDSKIIRLSFPEEEYPGFYTTSEVKPSVSVQVGSEG